jgi:hypothetical protein
MACGYVRSSVATKAEALNATTRVIRTQVKSIGHLHRGGFFECGQHLAKITVLERADGIIQLQTPHIGGINGQEVLSIRDFALESAQLEKV